MFCFNSKILLHVNGICFVLDKRNFQVDHGLGARCRVPLLQTIHVDRNTVGGAEGGARVKRIVPLTSTGSLVPVF